MTFLGFGHFARLLSVRLGPKGLLAIPAGAGYPVLWQRSALPRSLGSFHGPGRRYFPGGDGQSVHLCGETTGCTRTPLDSTGFSKRNGYKNEASAAVAALRMTASNASHKHWVFTSFDLTLLDQFPVFVAEPERKIKYLCCQVERCPATEREHLQGYVEFTERVGLRTAKLRTGAATGHFEPRRGMSRGCHLMMAWP